MPFMCDNCQWDYKHACHDPRKPNVTWEMGCKDFEWRTSPDKVSSPFDPRHVGYYPGEYKRSWWKRLFMKEKG